MDENTQKLGDKILAELREVQRLIHDAITEIKKQHQGSSQSADNSKNEGYLPALKIAALQPHIEPAVPESSATAKKNEKSFPKLRRAKPVVELVGVSFLVIYTGVTIVLWCSARDANRLSHEHFVKDERPYVWLRNDLLFPAHIQATKDGKITDERAVWDWHFTNYGKTPALHVRFVDKMNIGEHAITEERNLGGVADRTAAPLPPGKDDFSTAISPDRIASNEVTRLINGFDGSVVVYGRIKYTDASGEPYESGFCFATLRTRAVQYCQEENANYIK